MHQSLINIQGWTLYYFELTCQVSKTCWSYQEYNYIKLLEEKQKLLQVTR